MEVDIRRKSHMIDQIVALDLSARGFMRGLYDASAATVDKPLCLAAAERIANVANKGDVMFVITGFPMLPDGVCETDGPPGAAVIVETLKAMGVKPILVSDKFSSKIVGVASPGTEVLEIPLENEKAESEGKRLLSEYKPSALISIERPGCNDKQAYHVFRGFSITHFVGNTDYLFKYGREAGLATVAVADVGNELGCGKISDFVREKIPRGAKCQCPCEGGIAATTPADVLVIGGTSNWGGYGFAACLSMLKGLKYRHNRESELKVLKRINKAGAIDGVTLKNIPYVDGLPISVNGSVIDFVWTIVNSL